MNFSVTLEVNQVCNLKCKYCYLGDKNNTFMSYDIAERSIHMSFNRAKKLKFNEIQFDFIGGEPLLSFLFIERLVNNIVNINYKYNFKLLFSMTTNGTIMSRQIIDFLVKYNFDIKLSIDGNKATNDKNRIFINSKQSVYDRIMDSMIYFKEYEKLTKKRIQVTNVITKNNYENYFDSAIHLVKVLGFKFIDVAIDYTADWNENEIMIIESGIERLLIECLTSKSFYFTDIGNIASKSKKVCKCYTCGAGIISIYIRTNGTIFCCPTNLNKNVCLGDVYSGIDENKILFLCNFDEVKNDICQNCKIYDYCSVKGCAMGNILENNDINIPCKFLCKLEKFYYNLSKRYKINT